MPIRLTGIASGLDTDAMIKELMKAERIPVDKLLQKKQTMEWKVERYTSLNLQFSNLRESLSTLRFSGGWNKTDGNGNTVRLSTDEIIAKVKDFVNKYNDTMTSISGALNEEVYRDYQPLTSDEKAALSETDIKNWETKAKSGILRNDDVLKSALNDLRGLTSAVVSGVDPEFDTLSEIGITTPKYIVGASAATNGKLILDENKLREAVEKNPEAVISLFSAQGADPQGKGILQRAYDAMNTAISSVTRKISGGNVTNLGLVSQMNQIDKQVAIKNEQLNKREDRYYQMFAAMEKALTESNAMSSWLAQQFA